MKELLKLVNEACLEFNLPVLDSEKHKMHVSIAWYALDGAGSSDDDDDLDSGNSTKDSILEVISLNSEETEKQVGKLKYGISKLAIQCLGIKLKMGKKATFVKFTMKC